MQCNVMWRATNGLNTDSALAFFWLYYFISIPKINPPEKICFTFFISFQPPNNLTESWWGQHLGTIAIISNESSIKFQMNSAKLIYDCFVDLDFSLAEKKRKKF